MKDSRFDDVTRHAATLDRKAALAALGGSVAALTAARAQPAAAGNNCGKKAKKKCKKQVKPCQQYWDDYCEGNQECKKHFHDCCEYLKKCKGSQYFECTVIPM